MPQNSYNQIPYSTWPTPQTHPDRLAAIATFFGMDPAPVTRCRVLEIGCGDGSNLIPMAYALPTSQFTGIDLADAPIAAGRRTAAALELRNLTLLAQDLGDVSTTQWGEFDYIVAHGFYSWVPSPVRERLMEICSAALAPHGVAFISYNTYPGAYGLRLLREAALYHTRHITQTEARIDAAIDIFERLAATEMAPPTWRDWIANAVEIALAHGRNGIFHDELEANNEPVYFHQFTAHAARHGLQYLGEAELYTMLDHHGAASWVEGGILEREQYLDFLRARRFRQTLLSKSSVPLRRNPGPEKMDSFLFSAPAAPGGDGQLEGLHGVRISAANEAALSVARALGETFPLPLAFEDLVPYAGSPEALRSILFGLTTGGFANLHVYDFPCADTVTAKPKASRLARLQAAQSPMVTSLCHYPVELDDVSRLIIVALDGTRDHEQLARILAENADSADLDQIRQHLPASLEWLANKGLLEA